MHAIILKLVLTLIVLPLFAAPAVGAPQILLVMSTEGARPLECRAGICRAEFSSLCMQSERPAPESGIPYQLVPNASVEIVVTYGDGVVRREEVNLLPLRIRTLRGYLAIEIAVQERALAALGADAIAVEVGAGAYLVPTAEGGDPDSITLTEIEWVEGNDATVSAWLYDRRREDFASLWGLSELINALPPDRVVPVETQERIAEAVMERVVEADERIRRGVQTTTGIMSTCNWPDFQARYQSLRQCLQFRHDVEGKALNAEYWSRIQQKPDG